MTMDTFVENMGVDPNDAELKEYLRQTEVLMGLSIINAERPVPLNIDKVVAIIKGESSDVH